MYNTKVSEEIIVSFLVGSVNLPSFRITISEPTNMIMLVSSFDFLEDVKTHEYKSINNVSYKLISIKNNQKFINLDVKKSENDKSVILIPNKLIEIPQDVYTLVLNNDDLCISTTVINSVEIDVYAVNESCSDTKLIDKIKFSLKPLNTESIIVNSVSYSYSSCSALSIIKFLDKYGNISNMSESDKNDLLSVTAEKLDGSSINTGIKWQVKPSINEPTIISGFSINNVESYILKLSKDDKTVATSNPVAIFSSEQGSITYGIHWIFAEIINSIEDCNKIISCIFPTHQGDSVVPCTSKSGCLCHMESWLPMIPVNLTCDVLAIHDYDDIIISLKSRKHNINTHRFNLKAYVSEKKSCDSKRSSTKYKEFSKLIRFSNISDKKSDQKIGFVDLEISQGMDVNDVILRYKKSQEYSNVMAPSLFSVSKNSLHGAKCAILTSNNISKNEKRIVENLELGMTYISTGPKTILTFRIDIFNPGKNAIKISERLGFKYNRHIKYKVFSATDIESVYIVKNHVLIHEERIHSKECDMHYDDMLHIDSNTFYYIVVKHVDGHIIMSSPICITI